jgi:uncharacterized protein YdhG (YjbR/CyaY superfamily)
VKSSPAPAKKGNDAAQVRAYFVSLPADARSHLTKIRDIIRAAAPRAAGSISYGIPTFKIDGERFIYCAAFKHHVSLYPMTAAIRRAFADELKGYKTSTGTIQFPLAKPLPIGFVKRLVRARLAEMQAKDKRKR